MDATPRKTLNHGGTGHQVWLPVRSGDERSHPLQMGIMLNSRGERMTKALEGTEVEQQTLANEARKPEGNKLSRHSTLLLTSVALGDYPRWGGWPLINLILCIITIELNWISYIRSLIYLLSIVIKSPKLKIGSRLMLMIRQTISKTMFISNLTRYH